MEPPRNVVGPQLRKIREGLGLSQEAFAAKCQRNGWDISRDIVARIELRIRLVPDFELKRLADCLEVSPVDLFPDDWLS